MKSLVKDRDWEGTAEALARRAAEWLKVKEIGEAAFQPNERLVRDYVSRGILSRPERKGKEAFFNFKQLAQFLACRAMVESGWPLSQVSDEFQISTLEDLMDWIPGESGTNEVLQLAKSFQADRKDKKRSAIPASEEKTTNNQGYTQNVSSFSHRRKESIQRKTTISDILKKIGSELNEPYKVEHTAFQLASWLIVLIENEKVDNLTREDAEDIGFAVTATLLGKNSLKKQDVLRYQEYANTLSSLKDQIKELRQSIDELHKTKHKIQTEILDMKEN